MKLKQPMSGDDKDLLYITIASIALLILYAMIKAAT